MISRRLLLQSAALTLAAPTLPTFAYLQWHEEAFPLAAKDIEALTHHPFVTGLIEGTLPGRRSRLLPIAGLPKSSSPPPNTATRIAIARCGLPHGATSSGKRKMPPKPPCRSPGRLFCPASGFTVKSAALSLPTKSRIRPTPPGLTGTVIRPTQKRSTLP